MRSLNALAMCVLVLGLFATTADAKPGTVAAAGGTGQDSAGQTSIATQLATTVLAIRLDQPVHLDGVLDEQVWQRPSAAPLVQNDPDNGAPPRLETDWWVAYDNEALYIAARMHDDSPDSILCNLGRRDTYPASDWIYINLDTFNDDRTGYSFSINPAGVINDSVLYNDGNNDDSWDGIWDCAARIDEGGWTAEVKIPFSQLSFPKRAEQPWGINFSRRIPRFQERDELFHIPRGESGYMRRFPHLDGLHDVCPGQRVEVLGYTVGKGEFVRAAEGDPFRDDSHYVGNVGADFKWAPASNLMVNGTVNPDFGQVEVDPAVVNLSDNETSYAERRPFFVKDSNTWRFGQDGTNNSWNFNWGEPRFFYSRRIGRAPQLRLGYYDYADIPTPTTILGAGMLSGSVGKTTFGLLTAVTARENAELQTGGTRSSVLAEPLSDYTVMRIKRARPDGRRGIGLLATHTWRDLSDESARSQLTRQALSGGVDGWIMLDDDAMWALKAYLGASHVAGEAPAIARIQRSAVHYYQRPDVDHLGVDPTRTSLDGWVGRAALNKQSGNYQFNTALGAISPGFEINDLGFQSRADNINWSLATGYRWLEPKGFARDRGLTLATYRTWDYAGNRDDMGYYGFGDVTFANYWGLNGTIFVAGDRLSNRYTRGGPKMLLPGQTSLDLSLYTDYRRPIVLSTGGGVSRGVEGSRTAYGYTTISLQPASSLAIEIGPQYTWNDDRTAWVTRVVDPLMTATYGTRYIYGDMEYRELSMTTRVNWTFTPKLTLQAYVQPLFATGHYTDLREFAKGSTYTFNRYGVDNGSTLAYDSQTGAYTVDPDGAGAAEPIMFGNPDFNIKSLKLNMVFRWEYTPGSTLYFVWTHGKQDYRNPGDFDFSRDVSSLWDAEAENLVQVKLTKWLDL
jgi:hypothetical protein